jgi:hypothetical protein
MIFRRAGRPIRVATYRTETPSARVGGADRTNPSSMLPPTRWVTPGAAVGECLTMARTWPGDQVRVCARSDAVRKATASSSASDASGNSDRKACQT